MNILDFQRWVRHRQAQPKKLLPECDRVLHVIAAAGPSGITDGDLGTHIQLHRRTLDELLEALLQVGRITRTFQQGEVMYRATASNIPTATVVIPTR